MLVIAKRNLLFRRSPKKVKGGEPLSTSLADLNKHTQHHVPASKDPQEIPDWVGQTEAFRHAAQDGTIMHVEVKTVQKPVTSFTTVPVEDDAADDDDAADREREEEEEEEEDHPNPSNDERHVQFLQSRGIKVETPEDAKEYIAGLNKKERKQYFADFKKSKFAA